MSEPESDLVARLRNAADWVNHQMDTAPAWDDLLAEAADEIERLREVAEAARDLLDAENEMHQRDREFEELGDRDADLATRSACLDRAIDGRQAYTDARRELAALTDA